MSDAAQLIALAADSLRDEVLPHLPRDRRYPALMALNALGIALRQIETGTGRRKAAADCLAVLAAGPEPAAALAAEIRRGVAGERACAIHAALVEIARADTEESHPGARALGRDR